MRKWKLWLVIIFLGFAGLVGGVSAASCEDNCNSKPDDQKPQCLQDVRAACEAKLTETAATKKTLQNAIDYFDGQIAYTQSQINQTVFQIEQLEKEIENLSGKISTLDFSLDQITVLLNQRIQASYKNSRINPLYLLLAADGLGDLLSKFKYLQVAQSNDREAIFELEQARANYDAQKNVKEDKQAQVLGLQTELLGQRNVLDKQQQEKELLLVITKHDEARYQDALAKAVAELQAIQAIIAGKGVEAAAGSVNEGDKIASVIPGASACSTGAHLHFEVVTGGAHQNPFNFLVSKSLLWDNSDPAQNGSGSWQWPTNDPIRITQGYGHTSYSSIYVGGVHTGVDMVNGSGDYTVKASRKGNLYQGSIACGGGTLKYVRVDHSDDAYDTYYLHVNYF